MSSTSTRRRPAVVDVTAVDWRTLLPSEVETLRVIADEAGYESPYPGEVPDSSIEDRCGECGWTLFLSMRLEVFCVNAKCAEHRRDLTEDETEAVPS